MYLTILLAGLAWAAPEKLARVEKLIASGEFKPALQALDQITSKTVEWHLLASRAFEGLNDAVRAVAEAEAALAMEPRSEAAHLQLGRIFLSHNTPSAAYEVFTEAQQLFPQSFLIRLGRGLALKELQRYEDAAEELQQCLTVNPSSGIAFDGLGTALLHSLNYSALAESAQKFIDRNRTDFRGHYYLAAARDGLDLPDDASITLLRESIRLNSNFAASYSLLGKILLRQNAIAESVQVLEKAVALRPDYVPAHMNLAKAYRTAGRKADAEREYQTVRELNERRREPQPSLLYHRGKR